LIAIFGDSEFVQTKKIDYNNLNERDCLLIGEFVRRHHSRLAHEIAIKGVPTTGSHRLELVGLDGDIKDLAGLVARSHGIPIRSTFPYLKAQYNIIPQHRKVKSPYLMGILRIADYVQVHSERALKSLMGVKELRSPISRQEWRNHFSVNEVTNVHEDPEAYFVDATPADVKTYLKLVSLFSAIQHELDETWATLGEVYGRFGDLAKLGLTIRRIRSNFDANENFSRRVSYIPIQARFDSSGPDLLKLLVGPLYGYKYEVGIRELIQNSVDACRERHDLSSPTKSDNHELKVQVSIQENEDGGGWITVLDNGVGMTLDTVTKYFLIAGASFRNSDLWKEQHVDDVGQTRVMRGGRFGVGALALFLLGDEIKVTTRHFQRPETEGIEFTARIDESALELKRCVLEAGTKIEILVTKKKIIDALRPYIENQGNTNANTEIKLKSWDKVDWFFQDFPKVEYRWKGYEDSNEYRIRGETRISAKFSPSEKTLVPLPGTEIDATKSTLFSWNKVPNCDPYRDVFWRYNESKKYGTGDSAYFTHTEEHITVNGIRVQEISGTVQRWYANATRLATPKQDFGSGPYIMIKRPSLAIFDPAGICPINLQRDEIAFDQMDLDNAIAASVLAIYFRGVTKQARKCQRLDLYHEISDRVARSTEVVYEGKASILFATAQGISLADPHFITSLNISHLFFIKAPETVPQIPLSSLLKKGEAIIFRHSWSGPQNDLSWFRGILAPDAHFEGYAFETGLPRLSQTASVFLLPKEKLDYAQSGKRVTRAILDQITSKKISTSHYAAQTGKNKDADLLIARCKEIIRNLGDNIQVGGWAINSFQPNGEIKSILTENWLKITKGAILVNFE
jgi:hypothetical protein